MISQKYALVKLRDVFIFNILLIKHNYMAHTLYVSLCIYIEIPKPFCCNFGGLRV